MARIFPNQPSEGTLSKAERRVFHILKEGLADDYLILHSLPVYRREGRNNSLRDGEIDFVILHPEKGMLGVEVKGGGVEYDSALGKWFSVDYQGVKHKIKNPYEQVKSHTHTLSKEVKGQPRLGRHDFPFGHAVWFPDLDLSGDFLGISVELKNITLGSADLQTPDESIKRLFKNSIGYGLAKAPGHEGVDEFRKFYAPSKKITVSLSRKLEVEKEEIFEATISQYKVLSFLERFNHALISGAAGTGKTYLALEKAKRIVENAPGSKVLIVCYNKPLSGYLSGLAAEIRNIEVFNFHGLCVEMCRRAGMDAPKPDPLVDNSTFFEIDLPDALLDALDQVDDRYDAIIVDEGQDFHDNWWMPLQLLLNDFNEGIFYIFFDNNQTIYGLEKTFPIAMPPLSLNENCRNTVNIHKEILKYYRGEVLPTSIGPPGREPEIVRVRSREDEQSTVSDIVRRLVKSEKVPPADIAILTPHKESKSAWKTGEIVAKYSITRNISDPDRDLKILCSTIHSFKGLESPVVILTELSGLWESKRSELLYVGISRANSHVVICEP